jgi:IclR family pca regulon transcriptional regulator
VLLAAMPPSELDSYLDRVELRPLTPATVTSPTELRRELGVVRRRHWAIVDQELERGLRSAAAPVHDAGGQVIAAANIGALAGRITVATLRKALVPPLLESAASIERDLAIARP